MVLKCWITNTKEYNYLGGEKTKTFIRLLAFASGAVSLLRTYCTILI